MGCCTRTLLFHLLALSLPAGLWLAERSSPSQELLPAAADSTPQSWTQQGTGTHSSTQLRAGAHTGRWAIEGPTCELLKVRRLEALPIVQLHQALVQQVGGLQLPTDHPH
jgi:hypothetical protein